MTITPLRAASPISRRRSLFDELPVELVPASRTRWKRAEDVEEFASSRRLDPLGQRKWAQHHLDRTGDPVHIVVEVDAAHVTCEPDRQPTVVTVMTGACGPVSADAGGGG